LPRMGLMGGAIATLLSYLACIIGLAIASHRVLPLNIHKSSLLKYGAAAAMAWFAGSRLQLDSPFVECAARGTAAMIVYVGTLYLLDERVRNIWQSAKDWLQSARNAQPAN